MKGQQRVLRSRGTFVIPNGDHTLFTTYQPMLMSHPSHLSPFSGISLFFSSQLFCIALGVLFSLIRLNDGPLEVYNHLLHSKNI